MGCSQCTPSDEEDKERHYFDKIMERGLWLRDRTSQHVQGSGSDPWDPLKEKMTRKEVLHRSTLQKGRGGMGPESWSLGGRLL